MKALLKTIGIIAMAAIIGFTMTGCPDGGGGGSGPYTVTYNSNTNTGGTVPTDSNSPYQSGETVTVLGNTDNLAKTGYTFTGWNTSANGKGTSYWVGETFTITANITLYAEWTQGYVFNRTVTFNSNGGSEVSSITIPSGRTIKRPIDPTSGYGTFDNWYSDSGRHTLFDFSTPITTNTTIYAKWNATYEVGDTGHGGGKIFYRIETGFNLYTGSTDADNNYIKAYYLEAAPEDAATTRLRWSTATGAPYIQIPYRGTAIGSGRKNTSVILALDATAPAALACHEYENNGMTDWFLPSLSELEELSRQRSVIGNLVNDPAGYGYWTSTESVPSSKAYAPKPYSFSTSSSEKNFDYHVRAIRAF
ncbi:MAG: InlB B-repeat-containing protein [Treponema sp.]|jgi:uncharacterized repeat protein (TIGR02543 family)|nr:InlB B-repeat-containing protein [Treponema sp.]